MEGPFGRSSSRKNRSIISFHCGGSCTSNKSKLVVKKHQQQQQQQLPTIKQLQKVLFIKSWNSKKHYSPTLDPQKNQQQQQQSYQYHPSHVEEEAEAEAEQNYNNLQQDQHFSSRLGLDTQLLHHHQQPLKKRSYIPSSSSSIQYARKMGESHNQATTSSRMGIRNTEGEIVEVQGGHIVRSTGRKDRHSKVCTAKGPRDRRVRLSAHTAIQFYDVQDRLGYDRPSKAVDWLIKKAKAAIDELAELPPWNPETVANTAASTKTRNAQQSEKYEERNFQFPNKATATMMGSSIDVQNLQIVETPNQNSSFLPPALDSDSIADTIKSFFPMGASTDTTTFQNYPPDFLSRTTSHSQDLRLSLQSFQEPNSIFFQQHQPHPHQQQNEQVQVLFSGTTPLGYDASAAWSETAEMSRFQRMMAWNSGGAADTAGRASGGGATAAGFLFNSQPPPPTVQPLFGQNQLFHSQRGTLQSSNTPSVCAWIDQPTGLTNDHQHHHQILQPAIHHSVISGIGFASPVGEFSGFRIPARIQGEDEEHDGVHNRPSSSSSDSRH